MKVAIASFAKTIGYSEVKTRLAADMGKQNAEAFYRLSVAAVREVLEETRKQNQAVFPHWALADEEAVGLAEWNSFPAIWTGDGGLGTRLSNVSSELLRNHDAVVLIGTDSPQVSSNKLLQIIQIMVANPSVEQVAGPASDGGFWLWGMKKPLPLKIWESVAYSKDTTLTDLVNAVTAYGSHVHLASKLQDVDVYADLTSLRDTLEHRSGTLLPAQVKLLEWLNTKIPTFQG